MPMQSYFTNAIFQAVIVFTFLFIFRRDIQFASFKQFLHIFGSMAHFRYNKTIYTNFTNSTNFQSLYLFKYCDNLMLKSSLYYSMHSLQFPNL